MISSKFKSNFQEIRKLGSGAFSTVFEAKSFNDGNSYAIKKIPMSEGEKENSKIEIELLSSLKNDFVVQFIDSWIEDNNYIGTFDEDNNQNISSYNLLYSSFKPLLLFIQMELCSMTLEVFIKSLGFTEKKNSLNLQQYSKASDIFTQLLECVQYLHEQNPPVIHRDLKPENIMLMNVNNAYKVKLTDFGLSTYHIYVDESHTKYVGTKGYRAPEVDTKKYDTKADVFSLGKIMEQLFNININSDLYTIEDVIRRKYENAKHICLKCSSIIAKQRPDCQEIKNERDLWSFNLSNIQIESVTEHEFNVNFDKWPQFKKINKNLLLSCKSFAVMEEQEVKAIYTTNEKLTYALRITDHIDDAVHEPNIITELANKEIQNIVCGDNHVLCLSDDKQVYSFGYNKFGQLGNNSFTSINKPILIENLSDKNIIDIICGGNHSVALSSTGNAYVWGDGEFGQIGIGVNMSIKFPIEIKLPSLEKVLSISTGYGHCLFLSESFKIYGWGLNDCGQLGIGNNVNQQTPILISLNDSFIAKKIRCGRTYSLILTHENYIFSFGSNSCGQLGIGSKTNQNIPSKIETKTNFIDIETSIYHDIAIGLSEDNEYYVWGDCNNEYIVTPIKINFFSFNEIFDYYSNKNFFFNMNFKDKLVVNKIKHVNAFNQIKEKLSCILSFKLIRLIECKLILQTNDDIVYTFRLNESIDKSTDEPNVVNELSHKKITSISCGRFNILCLSANNEVYSFGDNRYAQLGNGTQVDNYKPTIITELSDKEIYKISCGKNHCLALSENGNLFVWGSGKYGQNGCGFKRNQLTPFEISSLMSKNIISISCGANHCLALSSNNELYGWGDNSKGQLCIYNEQNKPFYENSPILIPIKNLIIKKISCGRNHSMLLTNDNNIYTFGDNTSGQLGIGNTINQIKIFKIDTPLKFTDIHTSWCDDISAGLSEDGKHVFWGKRNDSSYTLPLITDFTSFDELFVNYSLNRITAKQINLKIN